MGKVRELKSMLTQIKRNQNSHINDNKDLLNELKSQKSNQQQIISQIRTLGDKLNVLIDSLSKKNDKSKNNLFCPKRHSLKTDDSYIDELRSKYSIEPMCEKCHMKEKSEYLSCKECEFLVCKDCSEIYIYNPEEIDYFKCSRNHRLIWINDINAFDISIAKKKICFCEGCKKKKITEFYSCNECKIIICLKCLENIRRYIPLASSKQCEKRHPLQWKEKITYKNPRYNCNKCHLSVRYLGSFKCEECKYDICPKCIDKI